MALEDIVQGVQVSVKTDGVDDATSKIGGLDKAIDQLSKTATQAGGGGGSNTQTGIPGLTKAFGDLNTISSDAFANIIRQATSGDFTGIATMIGGPYAGAFMQAGKAIGEFMQTQSAAGLANASMAKELATTPEVVQNLRNAFEGAGISGTSFERLAQRLARQISMDYPMMMRNVEESNNKTRKSALDLSEAQYNVQKSFENDAPEKATMRLAEAQEKLQIARGIPKSQFEAQDKLRDIDKAQMAVTDAMNEQEEAYHQDEMKRKEAQLALDQKRQEVHQQELTDVPHLAAELQKSAEQGAMSTDVQEASVRNLRMAIEHIVQPPGGGPPQPLNVLSKEMDLIGSKAVDGSKALEMMQESMGMISSAGGMQGMSTANLVTLAQQRGGAPVREAEANKGLITQLGLAQTPQDTKNFTAFTEQVSQMASVWGALMEKLGSLAVGKVGSPIMRAVEQTGEGIANLMSGNYRKGLQQIFYPELGADLPAIQNHKRLRHRRAAVSLPA